MPSPDFRAFLKNQIILFFNCLLLALAVVSTGFVMVRVECINDFDSAIFKCMSGGRAFRHDRRDFPPMILVVPRVRERLLCLRHKFDEIVIVHADFILLFIKIITEG